MLQLKWIQKALDFCRSLPTDYIARIYIDGSYDESQFDLQSIFDANAVRRHASASVVIVHDGLD